MTDLQWIDFTRSAQVARWKGFDLLLGDQNRGGPYMLQWKVYPQERVLAAMDWWYNKFPTRYPSVDNGLEAISKVRVEEEAQKKSAALAAMPVGGVSGVVTAATRHAPASGPAKRMIEIARRWARISRPSDDQREWYYAEMLRLADQAGFGRAPDLDVLRRRLAAARTRLADANRMHSPTSAGDSTDPDGWQVPETGPLPEPTDADVERSNADTRAAAKAALGDGK